MTIPFFTQWKEKRRKKRLIHAFLTFREDVNQYTPIDLFDSKISKKLNLEKSYDELDNVISATIQQTYPFLRFIYSNTNNPDTTKPVFYYKRYSPQHIDSLSFLEAVVELPWRDLADIHYQSIRKALLGKPTDNKKTISEEEFSLIMSSLKYEGLFELIYIFKLWQLPKEIVHHLDAAQSSIDSK